MYLKSVALSRGTLHCSRRRKEKEKKEGDGLNIS